MDADGDIAIVGVEYLRTPFEIGDLLLPQGLSVVGINRDILVADLDDLAAAQAQHIGDLVCDDQVDILFKHAVDLGSAVFAAVTCVYDDTRLIGYLSR